MESANIPIEQIQMVKDTEMSKLTTNQGWYMTEPQFELRELDSKTCALIHFPINKHNEN